MVTSAIGQGTVGWSWAGNTLTARTIPPVLYRLHSNMYRTEFLRGKLIPDLTPRGFVEDNIQNSPTAGYIAQEAKGSDDPVIERSLSTLDAWYSRAWYEPDDIYNADETALFFKSLPDKTFTFKGEKCHGGKQSKERLTLLQCANMSGTDNNTNNTKPWMTKILFKDWLKKVDKQMKINRKKILLFIDNCAAHTDLPTLANVKVMFLPANTTSKLQPLDQGIIHTFKRFYRREVVKHILTSLEEKSSPDINVLLAMKFARKAWYLVSDVTVKNCFHIAGFRKSTDEQDLPEENDVEVGPSNEEWTKLVSHEPNMLMPSFEDFVQIDDDVTTAGELTDDDIVKNCVDTCIAENNSEDEAQIPETAIQIIPMKLALNALETVHQYFEYEAVVDQGIFDKIYELEKNIQNTKTETQTKLTDFFKCK